MLASSTTALFSLLLAVTAVTAADTEVIDWACPPSDGRLLNGIATPEDCASRCSGLSKFSYHREGVCRCSDFDAYSSRPGCGWTVLDSAPAKPAGTKAAQPLLPRASDSARKRKRMEEAAKRAAVISDCPPGHTECVGSDGKPSCVDTNIDEQFCGGCPYGTPSDRSLSTGTDCTKLSGLRARSGRVMGVQCHQSKCQFSQCGKGFVLAPDNTHCIPSSEKR